MSLIAISQRVAVDSRRGERGERRDCLDQAWPKFIMACRRARR